jgi:myo-inositol-1(or 4)-monophosphatase
MAPIDTADTEAVRDLLELAESAARAAGNELLRRYGRVEGLSTKSSQTDPVSDADRASEALLTRLLLAERPGDGILGEEGTNRPSNTGITWVIDPLDGTVNYLYGLGSWAVSVAADDADGTLIGVVHDPLTKRAFTGIRGVGAWLDGKPIRVNDRVPVDRALLATGFSYDASRRMAQAELITELLGHVRDVRRIGSAALDLCFVAAGMVDAYLEEDANHWDWAAGALIVQAAGGLITEVTPTGGKSGILASGPTLHPELLALLPH